MSIFGTILSKLGFGDKAQSAPAAASAAAPASAPVDSAAAPDSAPADPAVAAVSVVDVVSQLEARAAATSEKLNWKTSIVDLLKLLELDSSFDARKALASELQCPADKMAESAQMNMWLHQTVLQKLADNGGNVPTELLHG